LGEELYERCTLTVAEIQSQFPSEWTLVKDPNTNELLELQSGNVLYLGKDREEVYRKAVELRPKKFAMLYTGIIPQIQPSFYDLFFRPESRADYHSCRVGRAFWNSPIAVGGLPTIFRKRLRAETSTFEL
jgi:hypothetical protein